MAELRCLFRAHCCTQFPNLKAVRKQARQPGISLEITHPPRPREAFADAAAVPGLSVCLLAAIH